MLHNSYNAIIFIYKKHINRKAHKDHVDRLTLRNDEGFAFGKRFSVEKTNHAGKRCCGNQTLLGENRVFGCINNRENFLNRIYPSCGR